MYYKTSLCCGQVYPDPVRVVSVGQPVDDLLQDPENPNWASVSTEFCGGISHMFSLSFIKDVIIFSESMNWLHLFIGTHLSNTREAKAFALISEEGIAKGIRRVTAFTTVRAIEAIKEADACADRITAASKLEGASLEKVHNSEKDLQYQLLVFGKGLYYWENRMPRICRLYMFCLIHGI